jgi:hypothetical protein
MSPPKEAWPGTTAPQGRRAIKQQRSDERASCLAALAAITCGFTLCCRPAFCSFLQLFAAFCSYFLVAYLCDVDLRRKDDFGAHYTNQPASHCRRYVAGCEAFAMS